MGVASAHPGLVSDGAVVLDRIGSLLSWGWMLGRFSVWVPTSWEEAKERSAVQAMGVPTGHGHVRMRMDKVPFLLSPMRSLRPSACTFPRRPPSPLQGRHAVHAEQAWTVQAYAPLQCT